MLAGRLRLPAQHLRPDVLLAAAVQRPVQGQVPHPRHSLRHPANAGGSPRLKQSLADIL